MEENLLRIYGAKVSTTGKYLNLILVEGEGNERHFINVPVKLNATTGRIQAETTVHGLKNEPYALVYVPLFKSKPKDNEDEYEDDNDELPF